MAKEPAKPPAKEERPDPFFGAEERDADYLEKLQNGQAYKIPLDE